MASLPIYYINLMRREDRRIFMERQFSELGLRATRIEAIVPGTSGAPEVNTQNDPWSGRPLSAAALCCGLSHLRAMATFLSTPAAWSLVVEDDAVISTDLPAFLDVFEASPPDAMLVRIETAVHAHLTVSRSFETVLGYRLHRFTGWALGGAGYLISRDGARRVLESEESRRSDIDVALFNDARPLARILKPLQAVPALCTQAHDVLGLDETYVRSDLLQTREPSPLGRRVTMAIHRDTVQAARKAWWRVALGATRTKVQIAG